MAVTLQSVEALATAHLPQAYGLITAPTSEGPPIKAESHRVDYLGVAL